MSGFRVIEADVVDALATLDADSVDAIICDPPYGLEFMGAEWDRVDTAHQRQKRAAELSDPVKAKYLRHSVEYQGGAEAGSFHFRWAKAALRVLKPGGHLVAFGGTRTYHRLACGIEDAGFEIRDSLIWVYGSGFPKSKNVGSCSCGTETKSHALDCESITHAEWIGWGTALKPGHEPIVLARKPIPGTVAANVEEHGTGAINVDGCRVPTADRWEASGRQSEPSVALAGGADGSLNVTMSETHQGGRWPPNVLLNHAPECRVECVEGCPIRELDQQSGESVSTPATESAAFSRGMFGKADTVERVSGASDSGGASRYFPRFRYTAKASSGERNAGLDGLSAKSSSVRNVSGRRFNPVCDNSGERIQTCECGGCTWSEETNPANPNYHPTVKPVALMRWLCRLVTPPGGLILDPFMGSGTTGIAALREGFRFIGIEREAEYVTIARRRIEEDMPLFNRGAESDG